MPGIWSLSKKDANYRPAPKPEVSCRVCEFMGPRAPYGTCKFVRGVIQGTATCDQFQPHRRKPSEGTGS